MAQRSPPPEPLLPAGAIQRRVKRRNFAMYTSFTCPDYYGTSAPSPGPQLATNLPTSDPAGRKTGQPEMVPAFTKESINQVGNPALSRQHRHAYAAAFTVASPPAPSTGFGVDLTSRHRSRTAHRPLSTRFEPAPTLTRLQPLVHCRCTFWSCLPDPDRLAVPIRPVVVRAACHHPRRSPDPAAPSFYRTAATDRRRRSPTSTRLPGASWRTIVS